MHKSTIKGDVFKDTGVSKKPTKTFIKKYKKIIKTYKNSEYLPEITKDLKALKKCYKRDLRRYM